MKEYIERDAAVAFLENMAASRYLIQCFESKEHFPAADVTPVVHGEWNVGSIGVHCYCECSICKQETPTGVETKYCPNCGACMNEDVKRKIGFHRDLKNYNITQRLADGGNK